MSRLITGYISRTHMKQICKKKDQKPPLLAQAMVKAFYTCLYVVATTHQKSKQQMTDHI